MIVICDTSPILYLLLINQLDLLPRLYKTIIIPDVVQAEMHATGAPVALQEWIAQPPLWLEIRPVPPGNYAPLQRLQAGEQAAILLAQSLRADLLIVDDLAARQIAQQLGLNIIGLLGILGEAAQRNWLDFPETLTQLLQATNFRVSPQLVQDLLKEFS
jgi:predicted nucleic acid-binding protein